MSLPSGAQSAEALTKAVEAAAQPLAHRCAIPVSADAVARLAQHAEQRLLLVIEVGVHFPLHASPHHGTPRHPLVMQEANKFMANCKRQEMAPVDVTHSLHMHKDPVSAHCQL